MRLLLLLITACAPRPVAPTAPGAGEPAPSAPASVEGLTPVTSPTGLVWYELRPGSEPESHAGQVVSVHYTAWLAADGTRFDSSRDHGAPIEVAIGRGHVIPGWDEGVTGMKVGEVRQLRIPAKLAYADAGAGGVVPPGADLIFEVELVSIQ